MTRLEPMNKYFNFADWLVIFAYLGGIIALGMWFGKDQRNTRDYFLGNRNIPWWGIGLSIVAAETSALTIIGVPALAYGSNIVFIQMIIGYVIARLISAVVMVPHYLKGEIYSPYQLFADRLGASARQTGGRIFFCSAKRWRRACAFMSSPFRFNSCSASACCRPSCCSSCSR
jgi:Na+/proline symporter